MVAHALIRLEDEALALLQTWRALRVSLMADTEARYRMERQTEHEISDVAQALRLLRPHVANRLSGLSVDNQNLITRIEQGLGTDI